MIAKRTSEMVSTTFPNKVLDWAAVDKGILISRNGHGLQFLWV